MVSVNGELVRVRDAGSDTDRRRIPSRAAFFAALKHGAENRIVLRAFNRQQGGGLRDGVRAMEPKGSAPPAALPLDSGG